MFLSEDPVRDLDLDDEEWEYDEYDWDSDDHDWDDDNEEWEDDLCPVSQLKAVFSALETDHFR